MPFGVTEAATGASGSLLSLCAQANVHPSRKLAAAKDFIPCHDLKPDLRSASSGNPATHYIFPDAKGSAVAEKVSAGESAGKIPVGAAIIGSHAAKILLDARRTAEQLLAHANLNRHTATRT